MNTSTNDANILDAGLKLTKDGLRAWNDSKEEGKFTGAHQIRAGKKFINTALNTATLGVSDALGLKFKERG